MKGEKLRELLTRELEGYKDMTLFIASVKAAGVSDAGEPFSVEKQTARLKNMREFIISLPDSKEKLLLYYRYICGLSMERTAELLGISTRSVYRMRHRALDIAAKKYKGSDFSPKR